MNKEANKKSKKSINNCFLAVLNKELDMYNTYFSRIYLYFFKGVFHDMWKDFLINQIKV